MWEWTVNIVLPAFWNCGCRYFSTQRGSHCCFAFFPLNWLALYDIKYNYHENAKKLLFEAAEEGLEEAGKILIDTFKPNEQELKKLALVLFLLFSVATALPKVNGSDFLQLVGGYSFVWLAVLYLLGACIRKCHFRRWEKWKYLLAYFGMASFSWIFKIGMENYTRKVYGEAKFGRLFTSYTAPTILLCAVCLLLIFETLEIKSEKVKKWITYLSPLAFSVYLIHTHPLVFGNILKGAFSGYRSLPAPLAVLAVLATAVLIYIACTLVDIVRRKLFELGKVRSKCEKAVDVVEKRISSIE